MTAPPETKTIRVSTEIHGRIMTMANSRRQTADEVLADLLSESTIVVPLTSVQHKRWMREAGAMGVTLAQFVKLHVEAAIGGMNASLIEKTFYTVRAIAQHHGLRSTSGLQESTDGLPESTDGRQQ